MVHLHVAAPAGPAAFGDAARIGPNAITRVAEAMRDQLGAARSAQILACAGLEHYVRAPPGHMVDEHEVTRLHQALRAQLPPAQAQRVASDAGARTGTYLLEHRIPPAARRLLRILPAALSGRVLAQAIRRHAWTFAGSGLLQVHAAHRVRFVLTDCPLCRAAHADEPCCDFYAACFAQLFRALVHPRTTVRETQCAAAGATACHFEVDW